MAEIDELNLRVRIVNEDEAASELDRLTRDRDVKHGGGGGGGGLGSALLTGAATALFNRFADALKSLETSIGSAFDASTSAAEQQAAVLEGLAGTLSPALAAAVKGALGPQVETEQQTIQRVLTQLQSAAEAIALAQGPNADTASIREAVNERLGTQINALTDIERRRAQGSVALQQILASRSKGVDAGAALEQAADQVARIGGQVGDRIPGIGPLLEALGLAAEKQDEAAEKQLQAASILVAALRGAGANGAAAVGRTLLGDVGS